MCAVVGIKTRHGRSRLRASVSITWNWVHDIGPTILAPHSADRLLMSRPTAVDRPHLFSGVDGWVVQCWAPAPRGGAGLQFWTVSACPWRAALLSATRC